MKLETISDLVFVLAILVPGFVFSAVLSKLMPRRQAGTTENLILGYLTGTAFNYTITGLPLYLILTGVFLKEQPIAQAVAGFFAIFIAPIILAVATGYLLQRDCLTWFFKKLNLRWINLIPTGWDWIFSRTGPCFVLVTFQNGAVVSGYFGPSSMASSDPERRDLYLEQVYTIPGTGPWQPVQGSQGIYVDGAQIAHIEFRAG